MLFKKKFKFEARVNKAASKANISLGMLKITLKSRDAFMLKKKLYNTRKTASRICSSSLESILKSYYYPFQ